LLYVEHHNVTSDVSLTSPNKIARYTGNVHVRARVLISAEIHRNGTRPSSAYL